MSHFDRIESYAEGRMTAGARRAFEADLASDAELKAEYDAYLASQKVLEMLAFDELGKMAGEEKREAKVVPLWRRRGAVAAAAVAVLAIGLFWFADMENGNTALAEEFYAPPPPSTLRSLRFETTDRQPLDEVQEAFELEEYGLLISAIENIPTSDSNYLHFQFLLGHAFLKNKNPGAAIAPLRRAAGSGNPNFSENAKWNLVIAHLAAGQTDTARQILTDISKNGSDGYPARAEELLTKLF